MWVMQDGMGWGWMAFGSVWMLLFWGLIIWLIIWAISRVTGPTARPGHERSALDILKERYARGELTKEEFDRMKRDVV